MKDKKQGKSIWEAQCKIRWYLNKLQLFSTMVNVLTKNWITRFGRKVHPMNQNSSTRKKSAATKREKLKQLVEELRLCGFQLGQPIIKRPAKKFQCISCKEATHFSKVCRFKTKGQNKQPSPKWIEIVDRNWPQYSKKQQACSQLLQENAIAWEGLRRIYQW